VIAYTARRSVWSSLAADDQIRRIRDLFFDHDQPEAADDA